MAMPDAAQSAHALAPCCSKTLFRPCLPGNSPGPRRTPRTAIAGRSPLLLPAGHNKNQAIWILFACLPLAPLAISKLTRCPSANVLNP